MPMLRRTLISQFSTYSCVNKEVATNIKGKKKTAQDWIKRQISDPYVKNARYHNFRCRSAFKLIQIDDKYQILQPGHTVIDCGAAPGGWCQVAAARTNSNQKQPDLPVGKVIGVDLIRPFPIDGVTLLAPFDFSLPSTREKLIEILNGEKADAVLSDMSPNVTGMKDWDHNKLVDLLIIFIRFAVMNTKIDGTCLLKVRDGRRTSELENALKKFYQNVKVVKPEACRDDSSEFYLLARNFKGIKTNKPDPT